MSNVVLPSGESNFYDHAQDRIDGSGINASFPNPTSALASGLIATNPSSAEIPNTYQSGILHFRDAVSQFSNASGINPEAFDFEIFNPYIHHYRINNKIVKIPFVSTYRKSVTYNPYRRTI